VFVKKNKWERRDSTPGSISQNFNKYFSNFSKFSFNPGT
jgi:hypothetical protein